MTADTCERCEGRGWVRIALPDDDRGVVEWGSRDCPDCGGSGHPRDADERAEMRHFYGPGWND